MTAGAIDPLRARLAWLREILAGRGNAQPLYVDAAPSPSAPAVRRDGVFDLAEIERPRILPWAEALLRTEPRTITSLPCPRSPGSANDFYSEAGYWWPDPQSPGGPYRRRDGYTNPDRFDGHLKLLEGLKTAVGVMASAYVLTGDTSFARHAAKHLRAWFVEPATRMNPHLPYAGAVPGVGAGRNSGIINTTRLVDVARGIAVLEAARALEAEDLGAVRRWFREYLGWLTSHPLGRQESASVNNHGAAWALQAAAYAQITGNRPVLAWVRDRMRKFFIGRKMDGQGRFPEELARRTPFHYSVLIMEYLGYLAQVASIAGDDLWQYAHRDGRGMRLGLDFITPYLRHKEHWPLARDSQNWGAPVSRPMFLLLAGLHFRRPDHLQLWTALPADPAAPHFPLIWVRRSAWTVPGR